MLIPFDPDFYMTLADGAKTIAHLQELKFELEGTPYVRYKVIFDEFGFHFEMISMALHEVDLQLSFDDFMKFVVQQVAKETKYGRILK